MSELTVEEKEKVWAYLNYLDLYRTKKSETKKYSAEKFGDLWIKIINDLGNGDPYLAAYKHAITVIGMTKEEREAAMNSAD